MSQRVATVAHCRACGDILKLGLLIDLNVFLAASEAFMKEHRGRCGEGTTFIGALDHPTEEPHEP